MIRGTVISKPSGAGSPLSARPLTVNVSPARSPAELPAAKHGKKPRICGAFFVSGGWHGP